MTDTQSLRLSSNDGDEDAQSTCSSSSDEGEDELSCSSYEDDDDDDEDDDNEDEDEDDEDEVPPPREPGVSPVNSPANSETVILYQEPVTPEGPKLTFNTSPIILKGHNNHLALAGTDPIQMLKKTAYASLALELEGAIHTESNLVLNAIPQHSNLDIILQQLTRTKGVSRNVACAKGILFRYSALSNKWTNWPPTHIKNTEKELGKYLNRIADDVRTLLKMPKSENDLMFSHQFRHAGPVTKFTTARNPDLVVVPRSVIKRKDLRWKDFRSIVSLKVASQSQKDERDQLSEYARLCFAEQYDRRHFIAFGLRDTKLTFYVFDRSGVLQSEEYNVHEEPLVFLRVAINTLLLDNAQLGYDPTFSISVNGREYLTVQNKSYTIVRAIFTDRSICGRGTVCLKVRRRRRKGKVHVIKDSWVDQTRPVKEYEMLAILKELKIKNVPKLIAHEIVHVHDESGQLVEDSTKRFREFESGVVLREHHRLVMHPYGQPLKFFSSLPELLSAIRDILQTIKDLNERGILHRDISIGNIVLVKDGLGHRKGYLIDFDFAIQNTENRTISKGKRSGTLPFMACDVLAKTGEYTALLDAESTLYVLIWTAFTQAGPNGKERVVDEHFDWKNTIVGIWNPEGIVDEAQLKRISGVKRATMKYEGEFQREILERMHPYFKPIERCLEVLRERLFNPAQDQQIPSKPKDPRDFYLNGKITSKFQPDSEQVLTSMLEAIDIFLDIFAADSNDVEGTPNPVMPTEDDVLPGFAIDAVPAEEDGRSQSSEDSQSQPSGDDSDADNDSNRPTSALSMNCEDGRSQTLAKKIGSNLKLRNRMAKETVHRDTPLKEPLYKSVLRSEAQRSVTAEDPEAPSLAPAFELAHPKETCSTRAHSRIRTSAQSLGKRSRELDSTSAVPAEQSDGEAESSKRPRRLSSRKPSLQS